jgi:hypothetical protein
VIDDLIDQMESNVEANIFHRDRKGLHSMRSQLLAAALTAIIFFPGAALADSKDCKQGICTQETSYNAKDGLVLSISTTLKNVTHYNACVQGPSGCGQTDDLSNMEIPTGGGISWTIPYVKGPHTYVYFVQACSGGSDQAGFASLGPSKCDTQVKFEFIVQYYAVAAGDEKGHFALSAGYRSLKDAKDGAVKTCGNGCKVLFGDRGICVAVSAVPVGKPWGVSIKETKSDAETVAKQECSKHAAGKCSFIDSKCAED